MRCVYRAHEGGRCYLEAQDRAGDYYSVFPGGIANVTADGSTFTVQNIDGEEIARRTYYGLSYADGLKAVAELARSLSRNAAVFIDGKPIEAILRNIERRESSESGVLYAYMLAKETDEKGVFNCAYFTTDHSMHSETVDVVLNGRSAAIAYGQLAVRAFDRTVDKVVFRVQADDKGIRHSIRRNFVERMPTVETPFKIEAIEFTSEDYKRLGVDTEWDDVLTGLY